MGEEATAMDVWEMSAFGAEYPHDHKQEKQFRHSAPSRQCPCIVPGCAKKFRPTTDYTAFLDHYRQKHGGRT